MFRLFLRTLIFLVATLFLASLLLTVLFAVAAFVFDPSIDTLSDVSGFGGGWPVFLASLLVAGVIVWRFLPVRKGKGAHAES
jgi:hypothetical protein